MERMSQYHVIFYCVISNFVCFLATKLKQTVVILSMFNGRNSPFVQLYVSVCRRLKNFLTYLTIHRFVNAFSFLSFLLYGCVL